MSTSNEYEYELTGRMLELVCMMTAINEYEDENKLTEDQKEGMNMAFDIIRKKFEKYEELSNKRRKLNDMKK